VTSPLEGEGKTFCAISLAVSIALEAEHTVLLVDANVVRPRVMEAIGYVPEAGLVDILLDGPARLYGAILRTSLPGLSILPAGCMSPNGAELLASRSMRTLLAQLAGHDPGCIVIFDAPPLLLTSEAQELAGIAGQVLVVVEAFRTPRAALAESLRRLGQHPQVSIVCNRAQSGHRPGERPAT
jgi:Mrp family chromosome partitioning ATPase